MIYLLIFACVVVVGLMVLMAWLFSNVRYAMEAMKAMQEVKPQELDAIGDMMAKVFYPPMRDGGEEDIEDENLEWAMPQHEVDDETLAWISEQMQDVKITDFVPNYHPDHEMDSGMFETKEQDAEDNS